MLKNSAFNKRIYHEKKEKKFILLLMADPFCACNLSQTLGCKQAVLCCVADDVPGGPMQHGKSVQLPNLHLLQKMFLALSGIVDGSGSLVFRELLCPRGFSCRQKVCPVGMLLGICGRTNRIRSS